MYVRYFFSESRKKALLFIISYKSFFSSFLTTPQSTEKKIVSEIIFYFLFTYICYHQRRKSTTLFRAIAITLESAGNQAYEIRLTYIIIMRSWRSFKRYMETVLAWNYRKVLYCPKILSYSNFIFSGYFTILCPACMKAVINVLSAKP